VDSAGPGRPPLFRFPTLRRRTEAWLDSRWMLTGLGVASFLESIILPIPLEAVLVPLMQKRRDRLWALAGVALLGCLAGAAAGYAVGVAFMQTVGAWFIEQTGQQETFAQATGLMNEHGFWFIMAVSVMPVPFQIAMLAAGATGYGFPMFMLAAAISRGIRYFGLAGLVWWLGDAAEQFIRRHKLKSLALAVAALAGLWLVGRFAGGSG
jgi:membrane protein YqaA with SNARE-associated domain